MATAIIAILAAWYCAGVFGMYKCYEWQGGEINAMDHFMAFTIGGVAGLATWFIALAYKE